MFGGSVPLRTGSSATNQSRWLRANAAARISSFDQKPENGGTPEIASTPTSVASLTAQLLRLGSISVT